MATMTTMALPVLPGKEEQARRWGREMAGPRRDESIIAARGIGVSALTWQLQTGPQGALLLVSFTTDDPAVALQQYAAADSPFDRWEKQQIQELTGIDFSTSSDGPLPETLYEWAGG